MPQTLFSLVFTAIVTIDTNFIGNPPQPFTKLFLILFFRINILIFSYLSGYYFNQALVLGVVCFFTHTLLLAIRFYLFLIINNVYIIYNPRYKKLYKFISY